MTLKTAKASIALVWIIMGLLVFAFLSQQTLSGMYGDKTQEVWNIFLPQFLPLTLLILTTMGNEVKEVIRQKPTETQKIEKVSMVFFLITLLISLSYFFLLFWVLISVLGSEQERTKYYKSAALPLTYSQPIAALVVGVFFQKKN